MLYSTADALRAVAVLLASFMPKACHLLWESLGAPGELADARIATVATDHLPPGARSTRGRSSFRGSERVEPAGRRQPVPAARAAGGRRRSTATAIWTCWRVPVEEALDAARAAGVPRVVTVGVDVPTSRWCAETAAEHDGVVAAVACTPTRRPSRPISSRLRRDRRARRTAAGARRRRDRAGLLPHRASRTAAAGGVVPAAHRPRQDGGQGAGDPRPGRPRRHAAGAGRGGRAADASCCTASRAAPDFAAGVRRPRLRALVRRQRDVQERRRAARSRWRSRRSTSCWSRPTRRSSRRCRTAAGTTRRT